MTPNKIDEILIDYFMDGGQRDKCKSALYSAIEERIDKIDLYGDLVRLETRDDILDMLKELFNAQ